MVPEAVNKSEGYTVIFGLEGIFQHLAGQPQAKCWPLGTSPSRKREGARAPRAQGGTCVKFEGLSSFSRAEKGSLPSFGRQGPEPHSTILP